MSTYLSHYCSPLGEITIAADDSAVIGVWFDGQAYFKADLNEPCEEIMTPLLSEVITTLDAYFNGEQIEVNFPLHPHGTTYQKEVFALLLNIPYGETCTYGSLAEQYFNMYGRRTSPRAIGSAVSHNPISILIPCHRVIGANGSLTGYAGGIKTKEALLNLEAASLKNTHSN